MRDLQLSQGFLRLSNQNRRLPVSGPAHGFRVKDSEVKFRKREGVYLMAFGENCRANEFIKTLRRQIPGLPNVVDSTLDATTFAAPIRGVIFHSYPALWSSARIAPPTPQGKNRFSVLLSWAHNGAPNDLLAAFNSKHEVSFLGVFDSANSLMPVNVNNPDTDFPQVPEFNMPPVKPGSPDAKIQKEWVRFFARILTYKYRFPVINNLN